MAEQATTATGLERVGAAFASARADGRAALMPYLMGGFPDLETSIAVVEAYADSGADLIELGVPYSDPLADGPVIHAAATEALRAGTTFADVLTVCERVADRLPVLPMVYANMALALGAERFAEALADAGAAGAIVPDLPPDQERSIPEALAARGLAFVPFVAPTTSPERRDRIAAAASGFIYLVSLTGVTGEREALPADLTALVEALRDASAAPVAVGFGIASPDRAAEVGAIADGVIIGSRLVRAVADAESADAAVAAVSAFLSETLAAIGGAAGAS